ncbi:Asnovolin J 5',6'-dehydrogenase nvfM [Fulvia fulva]|uniref:Asnovolin J 5',6'-dehydrogenase nvfM n=1 Tax=Passalora fulva TaxID=5499 RepID=A0A9Q8PHL2_PASFU|nr:Asnovolin J 5',6'-dehydrogenase nvfM [Fulvia fulva]KAK4627102.1 Asnovolin J 5',6'-dehydrogenase nvfM [Fulvia fulva]KAK4628088.1 Asnovolin J 5',6'-dehydrogenase nvfM [Fulvia fulva]UJO22567.1 Asnovolin J 5',6'-dehydrogenase nvfM [Fulvia fulva]WPV13535.1 Asnovolin J 5',6'-dehydrogenase nvfM [Fulvia fulva]WPV28588.1 Asnovolin J 5',6'-dehydrogenase nvfM [Fulvia fulva]
MSRIKVGILGASGETGTSIINGLLEAGTFEIIALTRPSSMTKPSNQALASRGVTLREITLSASSNPTTLLPTIRDLQILISSIAPLEQLAQIPLATAAKAAGIQRFIPCAFLPVIPAGGHHLLRDLKQVVYTHLTSLPLPYTIIDVGWWYQISIPKLPSGLTDAFVLSGKSEIAGTGNVPSALTDLRDIGRYVARIIVDDRTLNRYVFVYNEMWSQNEVWDLFEKESGEKVERHYVSEEELVARVESYSLSQNIRGENTPEFAKSLGYLTSKELYPELEFKGLEVFAKEILRGEVPTIYEELKKQFAAWKK